MRKNTVLLISMFVLFCLIPLIKSGASSDKSTSQQTDEKVLIAERVSVQAAERGKPLINFSDGNDLRTIYSAESQTLSSMAKGALKPLALASADFDEDGVPDLVSSYASAKHGLLTLHRGNIDSIYPNSIEAKRRKADGTFTDAGFLPEAKIFEIPSEPDFVGTGDFDADGHWDVVTAARGESHFYFLRGNGKGDLKIQGRIELPGAVTALATGEVNRADGLTDVIAGITSRDGAKVLVFEGAKGAFSTAPETFALPAEASSFATGQMDDEYEMDLAIASGNELLIVRGRDRKTAFDEEQQATVQAAKIDRRTFPFAIRSLTAGDFTASQRTELALLASNGTVYLASIDELSESNRRKKDSRIRVEAIAGARWPEAVSLIRVHVSTSIADDLLMIDGQSNRLHILGGSAYADKSSGKTSTLLTPVTASLDTAGKPTAALPMRLNSDALTDIVMLQESGNVPTLVKTKAAMTFTVTSTANSGVGSLNQAILNANANPGADLIDFNIPGMAPHTINPTAGLPEITDPVTIDATTEPDFAGAPVIELKGVGPNLGEAGFNISAGNTTIRGFAINFFSGGGIIAGLGGNNLIEGNFIGTLLDGTTPIGNSGPGIFMSAAFHRIGGTTLQARNIISGNASGVVAAGPEMRVQGNFIGTDVTGTQESSNTEAGVRVQSFNVIVGGTETGAGNLISGNGDNIDAANLGVFIEGERSAGVLVQQNLIGTDVTGTVALGNFRSGIETESATVAAIGGTSPAARNVISGNETSGIVIDSTSANILVLGNFIGTNAAGNAAVPNAQDGIFISNSPGNAIGTAVQGAGNVISGNGLRGIEISDPAASGNQVQGNLIGTDATGTLDIGNGENGILIIDAQHNVIGGSTAAARNVISGNAVDGISIQNSPVGGNQIKGNFIGTDITGTQSLGNSNDGLRITSDSNNIIGGRTPAERNIISGNGSHGVVILFDDATGNIVQGNFIGTDVSGSAALSNVSSGVTVIAVGNTVGGSEAGTGNVIAFNTGPGVVVLIGSGNLVLRNSIFDNAGLGIDLGIDGVTANDPLDPDTGSNNLQNFPVLASATGGPATRIQGTLNSTPNSSFTIEFFSNPSCDSSGFGEGKTFIGSRSVVTNASGNANFSVIFPLTNTQGQFITATATDSAGNTSEFSQCVEVVGITPLDVCLQDDSSGDTLLMDSQTGDYVFTRCADGFTFSGKGVVRKKGCSITLDHSAQDRRVTVKVDSCTKKGTASIQIFSLGRTFTLTDRNTANNTCSCPSNP